MSMGRRAILCYYDGESVYDKAMFTYQGGDSKGFVVSDDITYRQLLDKMHQITKTTSDEFNLMITVVYGDPIHGFLRPHTIKDDEDLEAFMLFCGQTPSTHIPLYVEKVRRCPIAEDYNSDDALHSNPSSLHSQPAGNDQIADASDIHDTSVRYRDREVNDCDVSGPSHNDTHHVSGSDDVCDIAGPSRSDGYHDRELDDCDLAGHSDYDTQHRLGNDDCDIYGPSSSDRCHERVIDDCGIGGPSASETQHDVGNDDRDIPGPSSTSDRCHERVNDDCGMGGPLANDTQHDLGNDDRDIPGPSSSDGYDDRGTADQCDLQTPPANDPSDDAFVNSDRQGYPNFVDDPNDILRGQVYKDKGRLQYSLCKYAMRRKFQHKVIKSNKTIYTIGCIVADCSWRMHASKLNGLGMFKIRTYNSKHTCTMSFEAIRQSETTNADGRTETVTSKRKGRDHRQATSLMSSEFGVGRMSSGLTCTAKEIQYRMSETYGVEISYKKAWKGKEMATKQVLGSYEGSYNELPAYLHELKRANLGTVTELQVNEETNSFQRCFIALGQCIRSVILHVRRVLCVDAAHLTGRYKGVLFMATALDGNNHILPVAYGIGESENNSSWRWFLGILSRSLGDLPGLVIVSDRHKGLVSEVPGMFPHAIHGYCAHHILGNMKKACSDDSMREYFWGAVKTYRTSTFWEMMRCIQMSNPTAYQFLSGIEKERWANAFFPGMRYNIVTTNIVESMNALFVDAREYPVTKLLETIRSKIQHFFLRRRDEALACNEDLTPWASKRLSDLYQSEVRRTQCTAISADEFQVTAQGTMDVVNLIDMKCTCNEFAKMLLPCVHVMAACDKFQLDMYKYCSPLYFNEIYRKTYQESVYPVLDRTQWNTPDEVKVLCEKMKPPETRRSAGRPKKVRITSQGEDRTRPKCSRCNRTGHNRRRCTFIPAG